MVGVLTASALEEIENDHLCCPMGAWGRGTWTERASLLDHEGRPETFPFQPQGLNQEERQQFHKERLLPQR